MFGEGLVKEDIIREVMKQHKEQAQHERLFTNTETSKNSEKLGMDTER